MGSLACVVLSKKMSRRPGDPRRAEAKRLHATEGLTQGEIADRLGVCRRTVERWAVADDWATRRPGGKSAKEVVETSATAPGKPAPIDIRARVAKMKSEYTPEDIDELFLLDRALVTVAEVMGGDVAIRDIGTCASALCKLIELRLKLKPRSASQLAEMAIELGVTPAEFVAELKRHWAHERAA